MNYDFTMVLGRNLGGSDFEPGLNPGGSDFNPGRTPGGSDFNAGSKPSGIFSAKPMPNFLRGSFNAPGGSDVTFGNTPGSSDFTPGRTPGGSDFNAGRAPGGYDFNPGRTPGGSDFNPGQTPGGSDFNNSGTPGGSDISPGQRPGGSSGATNPNLFRGSLPASSTKPMFETPIKSNSVPTITTSFSTPNIQEPLCQCTCQIPNLSGRKQFSTNFFGTNSRPSFISDSERPNFVDNQPNKKPNFVQDGNRPNFNARTSFSSNIDPVDALFIRKNS